MTYIVVFRHKASPLSPVGYLGQVLNGNPPRGRKKSRRQAPWHWEIVFQDVDAHRFEDVREAVKAARRQAGKWPNLETRVVTTDGRQRVWPFDNVDIVSAIGLIAV